MRLSPFVASFDSSSAMVRALAGFLHGKDYPYLGRRETRFLTPLLVAANALPVRLRRAVYEIGSGSEAVPPARLPEIRAERIAEAVASAYPERRYPAVAIGSPSGALIHLAAALGIPWLPQTLLIPVRQPGIDPDDPRSGLEFGRRHAPRLLDANPELVLHQLHDPNQDRLTMRRIAYLRVKWRSLARAYERFLVERLEPGGTILVAECTARWPTTAAGERHVFQFGALGGMRAAEYFEGSREVANYLGRFGSRRLGWDPPLPDGERPEAEWGFEPALRGDLERVAQARGYPVERLVFPDPEALSPPVAELHRRWYRARGIEPLRLLVGSFIVFEPWWTLRTGSVPFWMTFNTRPSYEALSRYLDQAEPYDDLDLMLFAHGVDSVGVVPAREWRRLLARARVAGRFRGVDPRRFPADLGVLARYNRAVRRIPDRHPMPAPLPLEVARQGLQGTGPGERPDGGERDVAWLAGTAIGDARTPVPSRSG